ncbi:hypothetical protein SHKM778_26700 [Streptomyces sp. KM77-8]|uniref:FXSXX-COOH protein n=1 Tax=Streptomyces haneummycinicus TaxID=3074435 RepID=A0AAT9HFV2_9ACTN
MHQPPAQRDAAAAVQEPAVMAGAPVRESDLADLAALPLTAVDGLAPLRSDTRLLTEVLRSRDSMRGGASPPGPSDGPRAGRPRAPGRPPTDRRSR